MSYYNAMKIVKESLPVQVIAILVCIIGGSFLNLHIENFLALPILLSFIPLINGIGGNISSVFGARLTSALHIGSISRANDRELKENAALFFVMGFLVFSITALFIYLTSSYTYETVSWKIVLVPMFAGTALVLFLIPVTLVVAFLSFKAGIDPDNVVMPAITTIGDFAGILLLLLSIKVIGI
jgi:mgtE-like transporter